MTVTLCSRPNCTRASDSRGLCKQHYPIAYPAHLRGDVDPTHAREHLAALRARGYTKPLLAQHGVSDGMIRRIELGRQNIRALTEAKVLAIPLPDIWLPTLASIDATGTRRRLQALGAIGYSQNDIGARLGVIQRRISKIVTGEKVSAATAAKVAALFNELHLTPGPSRTTRRHAEIRGWHGPFAWDDDTIDDPAAEPIAATAVPPRRGVVPADFADIVADHRDLGRTDREVAERIGLTLDAFQTRLRRLGIPARTAAIAS